jgi:VanZ family protein
VIAIESTQYFGSDRTSHPLRVLCEFLFGPFADYRWDAIHRLIRKCGHFFGYGMIALLWLRAWRMTLADATLFKDALLGLLGTAIVATFDEWHQVYLPNRSGSPRDVLLDCAGATTILLIAYLYLRIAKPAPQAQTE